WVEFTKLKWKTAQELIKKCKQNICKTGYLLKSRGLKLLTQAQTGLLVIVWQKNINTPLVNIGLSPANLLQSRILKTKLLIKDIQNKKISININEKMKENQSNQKKKYFDNKGTIIEVVFEEKEKIWLQDKVNKTWSEATPRCYLLRDSRGRELRRNIIFMRKRKTVSLEFEEEEVKGDGDVISKKVRTSERTKKKPERLIIAYHLIL
ncbi:Uncharacterized protein FWK35_00034197, partial [Aphis craccivora]